MKIIGIDAETFYSTDYSLSKLTTEEYVRDPRFEAILLSIKVDSAPTYWVPGPDIKRELQRLDLEHNAMCSHHAHFDGFIMNHHFGVRPKLHIDTLGMGRALHGANGKLSLAKLAERYGLRQKGTEVHNVKGMRLRDFTAEGLRRYGDYSCLDTDLCYELAQLMLPHFSREELEIHDKIIRMFTEPCLRLDVPVLEKYVRELAENKARLLEEAGADKASVMSNERFATILRDLGVEPPMKQSPSWLKKPPEERDPAKEWTYAFSKTDKAMQELQEHEDERVQVVVEARLENKSTIMEKGGLRMISMASRGPATIYLKYSGASGTHRLSAGDKINWQALKRGSPLRDAVMAEKGSVCVAGDSSNIEARIIDWLSGQDDMVEVYRKADRKEGPDAYCVLAERIYKRPVIKADHPMERQMGKVCIAQGTLVLCYDGWKPIECVAVGDRVWDGEEWVWVAGSVCNGLKPTLELCGIWLTPDHQVWSGIQWWDAQRLVRDEKIRCLALGTAAANLPLRGISSGYEGVSRPLSYSANAADLNTQSIGIMSRTSKLYGVTFAHFDQAPQPVKATGNILTSYRMTTTERGYSTAYHLQSVDATTPIIADTSTMGAAASLWRRNGVATDGHFCGTLLRYRAGMIPLWTWTGKIIIEGMSQGILGSYPVPRTPLTSGASVRCSRGSQNLRRKLPVYDVINAGPRNRFTVMTDDGPLIVHNCKLGLGFGMGHEKFISTVRSQARDEQGKPVIITPEFSKEVVGIYRGAHQQVQKLWKRGGDALRAIAEGRCGVDVDYRGIVKTCKDGLLMPNGLKILFPDLQFKKAAEGWGGEWSFWNGKKREKIYGAKLIENIVQCLARIIVFDQCRVTARECKDIAKWAHSVHDEGVFVTPLFYAPYVLERLLSNMRIPPAWAPDLPLNSEGGFHERYGRAKS